MDLAAALAALDGAATIVKSLRNIEGQLSTAELRLKMADLTGYLADAKIELAQAKEETVRLEDRVRDLEAFVAKRAETIEVEGYRYDLVEGEAKGYPYCPACEAKLGKLIRIVKVGHGYADLACPGCKFTYPKAKRLGE